MKEVVKQQSEPVPPYIRDTVTSYIFKNIFFQAGDGYEV